MTDATPPAAPGAALSGFDLELLGTSMASIAQALVQEQLRWNEGWSNWARMQMMNMQPLPLEANMDFLNRQTMLIELLRRFEEPGELLAKAGQARLKETIAEYIAGFGRLVETTKTTMGAMQEDNMKTQAAIAGIQNKMFETNINAAKANYELQQRTGNVILESGAKTISERQASFQRINDSIAKALKGDPYGF
ncbi:MAG TPA: hypothetical protein VF704_12570 [Allosphingosinicella sp.]